MILKTLRREAIRRKEKKRKIKTKISCSSGKLLRDYHELVATTH
jgi:hypothetical protein